MMVMPHPSCGPYHHHFPSTENGFAGCGDGGCDTVRGPVFCYASNQLACVSDILDTSTAVVLPRTFNPSTIFGASSKSSRESMPASGKVAFTAYQWQELQIQTMIYKYMMASIPVPSELLSPINKSPSHVPVSQSDTLELRFSNGSDPEPRRCRRTDGKKWRCSRDVVPDQRYCERHSHKRRPRSRKHVEIQSHDTNNFSVNHSLVRPAITISQPFPKSMSQFPNLVSAPSCEQPRCVERFVKGDTGTDPVSTSSQQWHPLMVSSSILGSKRDDRDHNKDFPTFQHHYEEQKQESVNLNPYVDGVSGQRLENQHQFFLLFSPRSACLPGSLDLETTQTRHFIDAWSTSERESGSEISNKKAVTSTRSLHISSLTLSMAGGNGIDGGIEHAQNGPRLVDWDRESGDVLKSNWLNPVSSPPGGPLGEALCLGITSNAKVASDVLAVYSNGNSTATSSCSRSSCDDGSDALNFIA